MKLFIPYLFLIFSLFQIDFLSQQKKYLRVSQALDEKKAIMESELFVEGYRLNEIEIIWIAIKETDNLHLYVKKISENKYKKLKTYKICSKSGILGPKRKQGDLQVPEGFYHINKFNPTSQFYLSLGINYPNASDRKLTTALDPGNDIYIHGNCVTTGCLPMTDDTIKEIYLFSVFAKNNGQIKIPVYIFPYEMTEVEHIKQKRKIDDKKIIKFWDNLQEGYKKFMEEQKELIFKVGIDGSYIFDIN